VSAFRPQIIGWSGVSPTCWKTVKPLRALARAPLGSTSMNV